MQLLFTFCTLSIIVIGLLIMTQSVGLQELGEGIARVFVILGFLFIAFWIVKVVLLPILVCALVWLRQALLRLAVVLLIVIGITVLLRTAFVKFVKGGSIRRSHREEL